MNSAQSDSTAARDTPLLAVESVAKRFPVRRGVFGALQGYVHAVDGVSFDLRPRETLGIVGEFGCGKSTLARMIVRLIDPSEGAIRFGGEDITRLPAAEMRRFQAQHPVHLSRPLRLSQPAPEGR